MKEMLLNIYCPQLSKSYDFWVPGAMKVSAALNQICDDISAAENKEIFPERDSLLLCSYLSGMALPTEQTLEQVGVRSGDKLAII